jgi:hypothetical protein
MPGRGKGRRVEGSERGEVLMINRMHKERASRRYDIWSEKFDGYARC